PFNTAATVPVVTQNGSLLTSSLAVTYQWFMNSNPIGGANSQSYNVTATGDYFVETTDSNGCMAQSTTTHVVISGIETISDEGIKLLQNPASGQIRFLLPENFLAEKIVLSDAEGRIVFHDENISPST